MSIQRVLMEVFYRIGFTPWVGHAQPAELTRLVEGPGALPAGRALDVGCGTGDASIYLAQRGWDVTGVDFVRTALQKARRNAETAGARVRFVHGDATRLRGLGIEPGFGLAVDNGCLHGMSAAQRDAYVPELSALVSPGARLVMAAFAEGNRSGPRGINRPEVEQRFGRDWELLSAEADTTVSNTKDQITVFALRRR